MTVTTPWTTIVGTQGDDALIADPDHSNAIYGDSLAVTTAPFNAYLAGNDTITGSAFDDLLVGDVRQNLGPNTIYGSDTIHGGAGDDIIYGDSNGVPALGASYVSGNDALFGDAGNDTILVGAGSNSVDGGTGTDTLDYFWSGPVVVDLSAGQAWGLDKTDTITGIENVNGSVGNDWINGDSNDNVLDGQRGSDVILGQGGNDTIIGHTGNDALYGGDGNDVVSGGGGIDYIEGGNGNDTLTQATSVVNQWTALHGDAGDDTISATGVGMTGMWGDDGNDTLVFGRGIAYVMGGAGADILTFNNGASHDAVAGGQNFAQVSDFTMGEDHVKVAATDKVVLADWGPNTGVLITTADGVQETMMLMGVKSADLGHAEWLLVG